MKYPKERKTVLEVYKEIIEQAAKWRKQAKESLSEEKKTMCEALAQELYSVAANLEATDEVNPIKES